MPLSIDADRLHSWLHELAQIGRTSDGGVSRVAFTDADLEARAWVKDLMRGAGLTVRVDPVGNIFGRREGREAGLPTILVGSHIDTVPHGGVYDGNLGTLAAIEVLQSLEDARHRPRHPVEAVVWTAEEIGLIGSRGFIGTLPDEELEAVHADGASLADKLTRIGGEPARVADAQVERSRLAAFVELHVEQGSVLDDEGSDIGVVEGFVGIHHYRITFTGIANHAGTTPMRGRCNALLPAAELVLAVDRIVKEDPGNQVGTVGDLTVHPGAANVIPGSVQLTVELRDMDMSKIERIWGRIAEELPGLCEPRGVTVDVTRTQCHPSIVTDPTVRHAIAGSARDLGLSARLMSSGAGHDAQNLAQVCQTGMVFVPSVGGISHSPKELTRPENVVNGANVLLGTVLRLDELKASSAENHGPFTGTGA